MIQKLEKQQRELRNPKVDSLKKKSIKVTNKEKRREGANN